MKKQALAEIKLKVAKTATETQISERKLITYQNESKTGRYLRKITQTFRAGIQAVPKPAPFRDAPSVFLGARASKSRWPNGGGPCIIESSHSPDPHKDPHMTQSDSAPAPGAKSGRIPFGEKIAYGFGDLASCLYWSTFMLYLPFFYTDVFGISAGAVAALLLVARIWDGVNDPMVGAIADRTNTRWGKFRPYFIWMSLPLALLGFLTFLSPDLVFNHPTTSVKILWAFLTYNLLMMAYTAINIPYTALLGVISPNAVDRTMVSSIKFIFAFGAGVLISWKLLDVVQMFGGTKEWIASNAGKIAEWTAADPTHTVNNHPEMIHNLQVGWASSFALVGVLAMIFFFITFLFTHERVKPSINQKTSLLKDLRDLVHNGPWFILLGVTVTYVFYTAIRSSATAYYFKYFVSDKEGIQTIVYPFYGTVTMSFDDLVSLFNTVGQGFSIVGLFILPFIVALIGKKKAFMVLMGIGSVCTGAFYFLGASDTFAMMALQAAGSATGGPLAALLWAMYADTADYSDWKNGRRATGLVFSASTMSQKVGWALSAFVVLGLLQLLGFKANVVQNLAVTHNLMLLMSVIPAFFGLVAIGILCFFPLNDTKMKGIAADLSARKDAEDAESAKA
jgi:GPH family glycoside/pentoside/hexuronide:cation symporter